MEIGYLPTSTHGVALV